MIVTEEMLATGSLEELEVWKTEIDRNLAGLKARLSEAKRNAAMHGDYSDTDWLRRSEYAAKMLGQTSQRLARRTAERRKEAKRSKSLRWEEAFIKATREIVGPDELRMIVSMAHDLVKESENGA